MQRSALLACAGLAILAACAAPRGGASPSSASRAPAAQTASARGSKPKLICRTERPVGSNIPERVCYTQEQLDAMSRAAQDAHRRAVQNMLPNRNN